MAINMNDTYIKAEVVPASAKQLGSALCTYYGQPSGAFGCKGNDVHDSGYHRSRAWVLNSPDSQYGHNDYSVRQQPDLSGDPNLVSGWDFTPGGWGTPLNEQNMIQITSALLDAARNRDPRLASLREVAGTVDGRSVITFNCADGSLKSPFDSSHLEHIHGSWWRSMAANDHQGIFEIITGEGMACLESTDPDFVALWAAMEALRDGHPDVRVGPVAGAPVWLVREVSAIRDAVAELQARPVATVTLSATDRSAIVAELTGTLELLLERVRLDIPPKS